MRCFVARRRTAERLTVKAWASTRCRGDGDWIACGRIVTAGDYVAGRLVDQTLDEELAIEIETTMLPGAASAAVAASMWCRARAAGEWSRRRAA